MSFIHAGYLQRSQLELTEQSNSMWLFRHLLVCMHVCIFVQVVISGESQTLKMMEMGLLSVWRTVPINTSSH